MAIFRTQKNTEVITKTDAFKVTDADVTALQTMTADALLTDVPKWADFETSADAIAYLTRVGISYESESMYKAMTVCQRIAFRTMMYKYAYIGTEYYVPWKNKELHEDIASSAYVQMCELFAHCKNIVCVVENDKLTVYLYGYDVTRYFMVTIYRFCHKALAKEHAEYKTDMPKNEKGMDMDIPYEHTYHHDVMSDVRRMIRREKDRIVFDMICNGRKVADICDAMQWSSRTQYYRAVKRISNDIGDAKGVLMDIANECNADHTDGNLRQVTPYRCYNQYTVKNRKWYKKHVLKTWSKMLTAKGIDGVELTDRLANVEKTLTPTPIEVYPVRSYRVENEK